MVFSNQNFSFSTQIFSYKPESNSFSDLLKNDKDDVEYLYEENIDDNFTGISTELSSMSSITTITSAYSSCSESSNLASSCGRDSDNVIDEDFVENYDSNLFINHICNYIDLYYNAKKCIVSDQATNTKDSRHNKKLWNSILQKLNENESKQDFFVNFSKFMVCLTSLESELAKHLEKNYFFDQEFILNLAFLLYEHSERLVNLKSSPSLVFEIDLNVQNEANFEKFLNFYIQKYVAKIIPILFSENYSENSSGRSLIEFFQSLFENEFFENEFIDSDKSVDNFQYEHFLDTEMFLSSPSQSSESIEFKTTNPISQSYKVLVDNLDRLQYICNDPINDYEIDSELFGRFSQDRSKLFSYFSASCYTMGLFDLKKSLFENPLQYLYESKHLTDEFSKIFKNDNFSNEWKLKMMDSLKISQDDFLNLFEPTDRLKAKTKSKTKNTKKSKWEFDISEKMPQMLETKMEKCSMFDEIIERIQTLNTPALFNEYFKTIHDSQDECACTEVSPNKDKKQDNNQSTRSWTVAPKLFSKNTTSNCLKRIHLQGSSCSDCSIEAQKIRYEEYSELRGRSDPKPIGSKPASMFTVSNSNSNRNHNTNNNRYVFVNTNVNKSKTNSNTPVIERFKSVWKQDDSKYISPFVSYENFNLSEYSVPIMSPRTISTNVDLQKRSNFVNNTTYGNEHSKYNKKFSVAPVGLIGKNHSKQGFNPSKSPPNSDFNGSGTQKRRNVYSYERNYTNPNHSYTTSGSNPKNFKIRY